MSAKTLNASFMTESKEKVEETTNQDAQLEETNTDNSQLSEELKTQEESEEVDYKAELEKALQAKEKAENKIVKLKQSRSEIDEEAILERLAERFKEREDEIVQKIQLSTQLSVLDNEVERLSSSEDEAKLIKFHIEHSIKSSGNIKEDVRRAKLLANENKIIRQNKELGEALKATKTASSANYSSQPPKPKDTSKFSNRDKDFLKNYGVDI